MGGLDRGLVDVLLMEAEMTTEEMPVVKLQDLDEAERELHMLLGELSGAHRATVERALTHLAAHRPGVERVCRALDLCQEGKLFSKQGA